MLKVIELFSGVGAPRMALRDLGIEHETIGISEIDKNAIKAYNLIHGETLNFGDITKIESLPYCDLLHASSPCTSFSDAGKKDGVKGASGLIFDFYRLIDNYKERNELPKYITFENVKTLKTKFPDVFKDLIKRFEDWGYNVYEDILNAAYFGNCQKRERLFVIGIRKDIDNGTFIMPHDGDLTSKRLRDYLDKEVDKKYNWPHEIKFHPLNNDNSEKDTTSILGWLETACGHETQSNRVWNTNALCPTITCSAQFLVKVNDSHYRKITEKEFWRLMGFSEEDFEKIRSFSKSAITKLAGNSICLEPIKAIYQNLFKS